MQLNNATDRTLFYCFNTPFRPPYEWLKDLAQRYPDFCFVIKYTVKARGLVGCCIAKEDEFEHQVYHEEGIIDDLWVFLRDMPDFADDEWEVVTDTLRSV